jgi:hypothetical protein
MRSVCACMYVCMYVCVLICVFAYSMSACIRFHEEVFYRQISWGSDLGFSKSVMYHVLCAMYHVLCATCCVQRMLICREHPERCKCIYVNTYMMTSNNLFLRCICFIGTQARVHTHTHTARIRRSSWGQNQTRARDSRGRWGGFAGTHMYMCSVCIYVCMYIMYT